MMKEFVFDFEKPIVELEKKIAEMKKLAVDSDVDISDEIRQLESKADQLRKDTFSHLSRWQRVQLARHPQRPFTLDYIDMIADKFHELHGDRLFRDDPAIVSGLGVIDGIRVAIIGHQKGRGTKDNLHRNFGMPNPEGYRKALRIMKLAEKFNLPIITFIDTFGAYPGLGAEERGQAEAIARNLFEMSGLRVPILAIVLGEGGSGGALALSVADRILMLEYSIYSVISPEGCASILYRDASMAYKAAEALKLTAPDLKELEIVDELLAEPLGGAHRDWNVAAKSIKDAILKYLPELMEMDPDERIEARIEKYGRMGQFEEETVEELNQAAEQ
ncbi:acetyl-CoA carboxylase carboxyltransferase subunit alpha [bacterium]|nr:acetyl-CoA carboxylase carboxyltransferase subunit alpha [bacterium]